jgi:hypothetical protein
MSENKIENKTTQGGGKAGMSGGGSTRVQSKKKSIKDIVEMAKAELKDLTSFEASSVISIKQDGEGWKVLVELLEKTGIPDRMDILGIYEARLDAEGDMLGYDRRGLRKRGDTAGQELEDAGE